MCAVVAAVLTTAARGQTRPSTQPTDALDHLLQPIRDRHTLPALAAVVVRGDAVVASGAVGVRKWGDATPVTPNDRFHLGSCTKAMTATMIGTLVEQGRLRWETTVTDVFPELRDKIQPAYRTVTLAQLLTHRSGLPEDRRPGPVLFKLRTLQGPLLAQRAKLVELALDQEPAAEAGTKMIYSNLGYAVAGAMAERVTGQTWEDLMQARLFMPLGMTTAGFGPPGKPDAVDQPFGHRRVGERVMPIAPGPLADNPASIGPAGTVHAGLGDWARFAALHLRGARGAAKLLEPATFARLHAPPAGSDYAMGWAVVERDWAGGRALTHGGSNGLWYAVIWLAPQKELALLIATNSGDSRAALACDETAQALLQYVSEAD
ncbi:MAG: beta-lactamase family protein [Planctomycetes bacterium]|nr:beta-lactamase family protein [Planctomycetota bacterium]